MLLADYNAVGLTSLSERDLGDEGIELYRRLRDAGELNCRVYVMYSVDAQMPLDQIQARMLKAAQSPLHRYNNMLWVRGTKSYMDGGMLTGQPRFAGVVFDDQDREAAIRVDVAQEGSHVEAQASGRPQRHGDSTELPDSEHDRRILGSQ